MCRSVPLVVHYYGCGHTRPLIVGTQPSCTGHCYSDQHYISQLPPLRFAVSNRRLCPPCHSSCHSPFSNTRPQLPVLRRPAPEYRAIMTPFEPGVYRYHHCLHRWRSQRLWHRVDQEMRGRIGFDETLEDVFRLVRRWLERKRKRRVYREEEGCEEVGW